MNISKVYERAMYVHLLLHMPIGSLTIAFTKQIQYYIGNIDIQRNLLNIEKTVLPNDVYLRWKFTSHSPLEINKEICVYTDESLLPSD